MSNRMTRPRRIVLSLLLSCFMLPANARAQGAPPLPTKDDLNGMYNAGQYRLCLQQIARVMRQLDRNSTDRYALLLLRGDCLLQLHDGATAKEAYKDAQKSADLDQAAEAYAMSFLISNSPGLKYTPGGGGEPISIIDRASRKLAMQALLTDQLQSSGIEIRAALTAQDMQPIFQVWPKLRALYALEVVSTGRTDQVEPLFREVGQSARDVLSRQLSIMNQKLQQIATKSVQPGGATVVQAGGAWWEDPGLVRMGLTPDDRQTLREILDYCPQLIDNAQHGLSIAQRLGGEPQAWQAIIDQANQIAEQANSVLYQE